MDIYDMLNFMGAEGRDALIKQMNKQMNSMQDSIIEQAASTYIAKIDPLHRALQPDSAGVKVNI